MKRKEGHFVGIERKFAVQFRENDKITKNGQKCFSFVEINGIIIKVPL